jgi:hypothetical protein
MGKNQPMRKITKHQTQALEPVFFITVGVTLL